MATITVEKGESIQAAIDKANDYDEIIVKKGIYNERLCIEKEITLKGESESRNEMPVVWNKLDDADEENTVTIVYGDDYDDEDIDEPIAVILVTSKCTVQNLIVRGLETGISHEDDFYSYDFDYNKALVLAHGNANFKNILVQDSRFYGIVTNHKNVAHFEGCEVERTKGVFIGAKAEGYFTNCLLHDNEYNLEMHDYCYGGYFTSCKLYNPVQDNAIFFDGEISFKNCEIYGAPESNLFFQNTPEQRYTNRQDSPWGTFRNCNIYGSSSYANISSYNPEEEEYDNEGVSFFECEIHDSKGYGVSIDNFPLDFCNCKFYNNAKGDVSDDMGLGDFDECEMNGKNNSPDDGIFVINDGVLEGYNGDGGDVVIPDGVTKIGNLAFYGYDELSSVTIPDSVTEIGDAAFLDCENLQSVTIPINVTEIGKEAFRNCTSLSSVTIPDSVTKIGYAAFGKCTSLQSVTIPDSVTEIGECAFADCESLKSVSIPKDCKYFEGEVDEDGDSTDSFPEWCTVERRASSSSDTSSNASDSDASKIKPRRAMPQKEYYMANDDFEINFDGVLERYHGDGGDVVIPDGVTEIGEYVFNEDESLTSVVIPNGVTEIGLCAFYNCTSLRSVVIPNSMTKIGNEAFRWCDSLTSVTIPDSVAEIGECAFANCENLESVSIPKDCKFFEGEVDRYGNSTDSFDKNCKVERRTAPLASSSGNASDFVINNGVLEEYKGNGGDVVIPNGVTSIGGWAFSSCKSLTSVTIPEGVTSIGECAFAFCKSLTSVTIPDSVTEIGESAFLGCENLESVSIPEDCYIVEYGEYDDGDSTDSFPEECTVERRGSSSGNASDFVINNGVLEEYKGNGGDVVIPDGVTKIGGYAFHCCSSLTSVVIPDGVAEIAEGAFSICDSLTSVTIPDSVMIIGWGAFKGCESLTSVTIPNSVTEIDKRAFAECESLKSVSIPKDCKYFEGEVDDDGNPFDSFPKNCKVERRGSSSGGTSASTSSSGGGATTYRIEVSADEAKSGCKKILKYTRKTLCNHCEGAGCASCNGAGVKDTETKLTLNIPAGTKSGTAFSSPEGDYNKSTGKKEPVVILVQVK